MKNSGEIVIGGKKIGLNHRPFIIAEMSANHNHSLERAKQIIAAASKTGADAIKLQTYTPDSMTIDSDNDDFIIQDKESLWHGKRLHELYQHAHTPRAWHEELFRFAADLGLIIFSTPFDEDAVDFLESLDCPCYKIASFENTDIPLIRKVSKTGKPVIISTGMATISELGETVDAARSAGCRNLILLKCTSTYPCSPEHSNISTIPHMRNLFACEIGLSDHTTGIGVSIASVPLGATVIEKHFTLDRGDGGLDAAFSMEPAEFKMLVSESEKAWLAKGNIQYGPTSPEKKSLQFRRSLYIVEHMSPGDIFTQDNLRAIRPGYGLPTKYIDMLLGKPVNKKVEPGTPMSWDLLG